MLVPDLITLMVVSMQTYYKEKQFGGKDESILRSFYIYV